MVLSSEFFPSPRAGASGMMEMTPARARIRASDRYLVIDCPPPCWKITPGYGGLALRGLTRMKLTRPPRGPVNPHPWISASVRDAIGSQVVSNGCLASYWGCATQKWRGVKNSKKAARSLRTRTSGRSASHAGRGETRLRAADCLGAAALYTSSASGKLPSCLFLSAFICVHLRPIWGFGFRVGPEEKHIWPQMNADERG